MQPTTITPLIFHPPTFFRIFSLFLFPFEMKNLTIHDLNHECLPPLLLCFAYCYIRYIFLHFATIINRKWICGAFNICCVPFFCYLYSLSISRSYDLRNRGPTCGRLGERELFPCSKIVFFSILFMLFFSPNGSCWIQPKCLTALSVCYQDLFIFFSSLARITSLDSHLLTEISYSIL